MKEQIINTQYDFWGKNIFIDEILQVSIIIGNALLS